MNDAFRVISFLLSAPLQEEISYIIFLSSFIFHLFYSMLLSSLYTTFLISFFLFLLSLAIFVILLLPIKI